MVMMDELDMELLDYLLNSTKNWIINDILEDHTKDWKYFLAFCKCRKDLKENHHIEFELEQVCDFIMLPLFKEYENNINTRGSK